MYILIFFSFSVWNDMNFTRLPYVLLNLAVFSGHVRVYMRKKNVVQFNIRENYSKLKNFSSYKTFSVDI